MKKYVCMTLMALATTGVAAKDGNKAKNDTLRLTTTPQMHCAGCENKIKENIRFVKGVKKIETSVPQQTVTIVYDSRKATMADFTTAFSKIGYEIKPKGGCCCR